MLGLDRRAAKYVWTAAVVLLLIGLVYVVRKTLFVFVVALLLAYLLSPLVNFLDRVLPASRTRTPALALAYMVFVGVLVTFGMQIGSRAVEEANNLAKSFPALLAKWQEPSKNAPPAVNSMKEQLIAKVRQQAQEGVSGLISAIPRAGLKALAVASDLVYVIIVPILAFFFLKDARRIRAHTIDLLDEGPQREFLEDLMADVHVLLAQYMRALLILCCATFICYGICFEILGLPYAILLAALAFALEFIPMVGPLTAAAVILLVTALSGGPLLIVLIFLGAYRMFQDYILSPHLMSSGAELHPLLVLFGVFAGAEIAGIAGTFLSVPVLAMVRILYFRIRKSRLASRLAPTQPVV